MKKSFIALVLVLIFSGNVFALDDIKFSTGMTQGLFKKFTEELGVALSYKPVSPAAPHGLLGFDVGLEISALEVDDTFWKFAIKGQDVPSFVYLPKIHAIKGLPFGIDVGAVFSKVPGTNIEYWGGELKYAILSGSAVTPAVAIRGTYSQLTGVDELDFKTYGAEATISKGFGVGIKLTPYAGVGMNYVKATPKGAAANAPLNLKEETKALKKAYFGARFELVLLSVTGEVEYNGIVPVYSVKAGLTF